MYVNKLSTINFYICVFPSSNTYFVFLSKARIFLNFTFDDPVRITSAWRHLFFGRLRKDVVMAEFKYYV